MSFLHPFIKLQQSFKHENLMFKKHTYLHGAKSKITTFLTRLYELGPLQKSKLNINQKSTMKEQDLSQVW